MMINQISEYLLKSTNINHDIISISKAGLNRNLQITNYINIKKYTME